MQHQIPAADLGAHGDAMARAVTTCVHCGFCLAACPTYKVMGEEMDSPRGRIVLMKQALEGELALDDVRPYIDRCLGCLACETACPSGVRYRELVVPFRARIEARARPAPERLFRRILLSVLESPARFRAAHHAGRLARLAAPLLPAKLGGMLQLLPASLLPDDDPLPAYFPAVGPRRARVALLTGCVQRVLRPSINRATLRVLAANGVDVVVPRDQGCCGALALHSGFESRAMALADHNARIFPSDVDAIVTNAAGCGSAMKEQDYPAPVRDVAEFLDTLGLQTPLALDRPTTVAYHDACHLSHGQGIRAAPRRLLREIANLTLVDIEDDEMCCGSAGLYNLEHPDTAAELGRRKAMAISVPDPDLVVTGNIGCLAQIARHLDVPIHHTVELIDLAYSAPVRLR
ncbi:MAG TPA: heterodisulfide reductase-related iron-sulfur binding cluster [Vicinamibacterales bacterium]|nr:heterodisulfide reductase-related iron-sulfur binding cluster [Vicinamibacterales bacterium]